MKEIIEDVKLKLNIKIENITSFNDGTTNSLVFSINNKYLIKMMSKEELLNQKIFFDLYYDNKYFQKVIYYNEELNYICFNFIEGVKFKNNYDSNLALNEIYNITSSYKKYKSDYYGYFDYPCKTAYDFLLSEVEYAKEKIEFIDNSKVYSSLNYFKNIKVSKYLLHGDFGVHNFIVSNNSIKVIDPMPLVFDPLYDFYFASLSSTFSFKNIKMILDYYDRDIDYKKNLFIIVFYIRMSRAFVYDKEHFNDYLELYRECEDLWK